MNELNILLPKPTTLYVGRQRLVIRKPNVAWWIITYRLLHEIKAALGIAEKKTELRTGIMSAVMTGSGKRLLLHLVDTISPWPRWFYRPILSLWITRQDPQTIAKIVDAWIAAVDLEEIKKSFFQAGEHLGLKTPPTTVPPSPASSK